jgi:hypothetical protein
VIFKKNANFFAKNWQKSPKIVIITSNPDSVLFAEIFAIFSAGEIISTVVNLDVGKCEWSRFSIRVHD